MLLLPAILTGIGLLALLVGLRGHRVGTEPRCRKCLFSLEGLTNPAVCPECGRDVITPKSTRRGMRQRNMIATVAGVVVLFGGGGWLARNTYTFFTAPGWARRVPKWWLVNVEARWATDQRLEAAMLALASPLARNDPAGPWTPERARFSEVLFERFSAAPPSAPLTFIDRVAIMHVRWWIKENEVAPDRVAHLIAVSLFVEPVGPSNSPTSRSDPAFLRAPIVPDGWYVNYLWRQVNAAGADVGLTCTGSLDHHGDLTRQLEEARAAAGTPLRTLWKVEVCRDTPSTFGPIVHEFEIPCPVPSQGYLYPLRTGR